MVVGGQTPQAIRVSYNLPEAELALRGRALPPLGTRVRKQIWHQTTAHAQRELVRLARLHQCTTLGRQILKLLSTDINPTAGTAPRRYNDEIRLVDDDLATLPVSIYQRNVLFEQS